MRLPGHYFAYVKHDDKFYVFDDKKPEVTLADNEWHDCEEVKKQVLLLVYVKNEGTGRASQGCQCPPSKYSEMYTRFLELFFRRDQLPKWELEGCLGWFVTQQQPRPASNSESVNPADSGTDDPEMRDGPPVYIRKCCACQQVNVPMMKSQTFKSRLRALEIVLGWKKHALPVICLACFNKRNPQQVEELKRMGRGELFEPKTEGAYHGFLVVAHIPTKAQLLRLKQSICTADTHFNRVPSDKECRIPQRDNVDSWWIETEFASAEPLCIPLSEFCAYFDCLQNFSPNISILRPGVERDCDESLLRGTPQACDMEWTYENGQKMDCDANFDDIAAHANAVFKLASESQLSELSIEGCRSFAYPRKVGLTLNSHQNPPKTEVGCPHHKACSVMHNVPSLTLMGTMATSVPRHHKIVLKNAGLPRQAMGEGLFYPDTGEFESHNDQAERYLYCGTKPPTAKSRKKATQRRKDGRKQLKQREGASGRPNRMYKGQDTEELARTLASSLSTLFSYNLWDGRLLPTNQEYSPVCFAQTVHQAIGKPEELFNKHPADCICTRHLTSFAVGHAFVVKTGSPFLKANMLVVPAFRVISIGPQLSMSTAGGLVPAVNMTNALRCMHNSCAHMIISHTRAMHTH